MRYRSFRIHRFNIKKAVAIGAPVLVACIAFVVVLFTVIIPNGRYKAAVELYDSGKYDQAIAAFTALGGYKDSDDYVERCYIGQISEEKYSVLKSINIGDTFVFGEYEQDNDPSNGKEPIEWVVLDRDGVDLLLLSKYALDCQPYNTARSYITWENCTLRKWLNDEFLNEAFSPEDQDRIVDSLVPAGVNTQYDSPAGNDTRDRVFLLSITEAHKYFTSNNARQCSGTAYCIAREAEKDAGDTCRWWLRSPGYSTIGASNVSYGGAVVTRGDGVNRLDFTVRPALWIDMGV